MKNKWIPYAPENCEEEFYDPTDDLDDMEIDMNANDSRRIL